MFRSKRVGVVAGMAVIALAVTGCGGSYGGGSSPAKANSGTASVDVANSNLGKILVDGSGRTLYLFEADKGTSSKCDGACASVWPPLTTNGKPQAQAGISAAKLGTTKRNDGKVEVTYAGHPLYYYVSDTKPGQLSGEGLDQFGAPWDAVAPSGKGIDKG
jgi:predicted lipoprotein with Yx(FWY)xxD motif